MTEQHATDISEFNRMRRVHLLGHVAVVLGLVLLASNVALALETLARL